MRLIVKILIFLFFRVNTCLPASRRKEIVLSAPAENWSYNENGADWKGLV